MNFRTGDFSSSFIVHTSSFRLAEGAGVEPTGAFAPTVFGTAWRARAQPSEGCIRGDSNPHALEERQLYRLLPDRFGV